MNTMTATVTIDRPSVAMAAVSRRRSAKPATVSASALALHLDCSRTYISKLEAEGVIHRAPVGCGEQLIGRLRDEAASLALFFLNEPEGKMLAALERTRNNLEAEIGTILGAELAAPIAEAFVGAVAGHRRELESMTGKSGQA
jgi:hypothetical protein